MIRPIRPWRVVALLAPTVGLAFVAVPLVLVIWIGFSDAATVSLSAGSFSHRSVTGFLSDPAWSGALVRSLLLACSVAALALLVGSLAAFVSVRQGRRLRALVSALMLLPGFLPTVVYAVGLVLLSARTAVEPISLVLLGHTVIAVPFTFIVMRAGMLALQRQQVESARLLGASRTLTFAYVVVPPMLPYAALSAALAGSFSLAEPVLAIFLLNDSSATLPQKSFQGLRFGFEPFVMTAAALIILLTTVVVVPVAAFLHRRRRLR
jgi:putative spermidine/putrescine transport system permease protein